MSECNYVGKSFYSKLAEEVFLVEEFLGKGNYSIYFESTKTKQIATKEEIDNPSLVDNKFKPISAGIGYLGEGEVKSLKTIRSLLRTGNGDNEDIVRNAIYNFWKSVVDKIKRAECGGKDINKEFLSYNYFHSKYRKYFDVKGFVNLKVTEQVSTGYELIAISSTSTLDYMRLNRECMIPDYYHENFILLPKYACPLFGRLSRGYGLTVTKGANSTFNLKYVFQGSVYRSSHTNLTSLWCFVITKRIELLVKIKKESKESGLFTQEYLDLISSYIVLYSQILKVNHYDSNTEVKETVEETAKIAVAKKRAVTRDQSIGEDVEVIRTHISGQKYVISNLNTKRGFTRVIYIEDDGSRLWTDLILSYDVRLNNFKIMKDHINIVEGHTYRTSRSNERFVIKKVTYDSYDSNRIDEVVIDFPYLKLEKTLDNQKSRLALLYVRRLTSKQTIADIDDDRDLNVAVRTANLEKLQNNKTDLYDLDGKQFHVKQLYPRNTDEFNTTCFIQYYKEKKFYETTADAIRGCAFRKSDLLGFTEDTMFDRLADFKEAIRLKKEEERVMSIEKYSLEKHSNNRYYENGGKSARLSNQVYKEQLKKAEAIESTEVRHEKFNSNLRLTVEISNVATGKFDVYKNSKRLFQFFIQGVKGMAAMHEYMSDFHTCDEKHSEHVFIFGIKLPRDILTRDPKTLRTYVRIMPCLEETKGVWTEEAIRNVFMKEINENRKIMMLNRHNNVSVLADNLFITEKEKAVLASKAKEFKERIKRAGSANLYSYNGQEDSAE